MGLWVALCSVRTSRQADARGATFDEVFGTLIAGGMSPDALFEAACRSHTEIVLTAHPTQVNRRTLVYKHTRLAHLLQQNDRSDLTSEEKRIVIEDLVREITALWQTDELRRRKPTPLDGADPSSLVLALQSFHTHAVNIPIRHLISHSGGMHGFEVIGCNPPNWMDSEIDGVLRSASRAVGLAMCRNSAALLARPVTAGLTLGRTWHIPWAEPGHSLGRAWHGDCGSWWL